MARINRILVAVKTPAARSQPAVRKAAQLAAATGARLEMFHAITQPLYVDAFAIEGVGLKETQQKWRASVLRQLEKHAATLRESGLAVDCSCDWDFPAYEAVVRRAAKVDADLIVAERHASKHLMPWLLRFNDWELLRRSPVPVLLIKRPQPWRRPVVLAAIDPQHSFAKPARLDDAILGTGGQIADALGGRLHVVHAFPGAVQPANLGIVSGEIGAALERQAAATARKAFNRELENSDIPKARRHLVAGHPVDVVPKLAKKTRASLVVMGGISRSGLKRLVIGNVAEQVLDAALPCDVLVLKPAHFKARVPEKARGAQLLATPPYV